MQINSFVSFYTHVFCMYVRESVWQIQSIMHAHNANNSATMVFAASKEQNQIIAFIFITQNFSIKSDEKSKWMEQRCKDKDKDKLNFLFFSFPFFFLFLFYFFRSVINKPTEQHVAYQWAQAKRLWCWII